MKKLRLIIISIVCLVTTLVVSSFAWFAIGNNGILSTPVSTGRQVAIYFSESGTNEEAMVPAKLKEGVLNEHGYVYGNEENGIPVPTGRDCLPQIDANYKYVLTNNNLTTHVDHVTGDSYLESPATIVYSQFNVVINDYVNENPSNQILNIKFDVKYYNVDEKTDKEISELTSFTQTEALAFNFFILETELTEDQLKTISTKLNSSLNITTIEDFLVTNKETVIVHKDDMNSKEDPNFNVNTVDNYRYKSEVIENSTSYNITVENIVPNQMYYVLIESYYSVPDQLVEGNLPLTGKFVLDLRYTTENM